MSPVRTQSLERDNSQKREFIYPGTSYGRFDVFAMWSLRFFFCYGLFQDFTVSYFVNVCTCICIWKMVCVILDFCCIGYFPCEVTSNNNNYWECNFRSEDWVLHLCQFIEVIPMHYLVTNNLLREAWEQRAIILISWTSW